MRLNDEAQRAFSVQDYGAQPGIQGVEIVELKRFADDGGSLTELGRLGSGLHAAFAGFEVKQVNYSEMDPGVIKAFHLHRRQTDVWFIPPSDKMLVVLVDVRARSEIDSGMAEGARWYPTSSIQSDPDAFAKYVSSLPADQTVVFYCAAGCRAGRAAEIASEKAGRKAANLGGYKDWQAAGLPVTIPAESLVPGR